MENVAPIRPQTAIAIEAEKARMASLPTSRLNAMIADAHASIAALDEAEEQVRAGLSVLIERATEQRDVRDKAFADEIGDLRKRIDELNAERKRSFDDTNERINSAGADASNQLNAIAKMRDAQRAVVSSLANDVTPAPSIQHEPATRRTRKAS